MSVSIAFLGDGLTAGGNWAKWFPEYDVTNLGVSGRTTDDIVADLDSVIELEPDAIVLLIGTNDLGWRKSDEYVVRNMETILYRLRKALPNARLLVQSVLPRDRDLARSIGNINRHIWQYAPTQHAMYLDLWPAFSQADGVIDPRFSEDHLHLTEAGYEAWISELKPGLETLFQRPASTTSIPIQHA